MGRWLWRGPPVALSLFVTSFLGSIFILFPFFPLIWLKPRLWRTCADRFVGFWLSFPVAILELVHGTHFHVSGDAILSDNPGLIIMNHRTRLDWLFFWSALWRMDPWLLVSEKISLKASLSKIPGAGWAMQCASFLFLKRDWTADKCNISRTIHYYAGMQRPYQLLLFPEGTDLCPRSRARMEKFAAENALPVYQHVLHPKTTGLCHILATMRGANYLDYVYDVIVGYGDAIVQTEVEFAQGLCTRDIHFHVERYHVSEIPTEEAEIIAWIRTIWTMKEDILNDFYSTPQERRSLVASVAKHRRRPEQAADHHGPNGDGQPREVHRWPSSWSQNAYAVILVSFCFWICTSLIWTYFFFLLSSLRVYFAVAIASFASVQYFYGGAEHLAINTWLKQNPSGQRSQ